MRFSHHNKTKIGRCQAALLETEVVNVDAKEASTNAESVAERPRLLSIRELAAYLNVPVQTLYVWRYNGDGPRGIKVGRHVRYRPEDVEEWLEERTAKASGSP
jgi:excisionase family DNA binding protein